MAEASEIQAAAAVSNQQQGEQEPKQSSSLKFWKRKKQSSGKKDKPKDASKIGCGSLFRRKKKSFDDEPQEKPSAKVSGTVKIEEGPSSVMWSSIVRNSMVGTGVFTKAAACSLESGGVLARRPDEFAPTVEQVRSLSDNFSNRSVFSAAGFGVADLLFDLQEETGTVAVLSGASNERQEGVLVTKSKGTMLIGVYTSKLDAALELMNELRDNMTSQGM